MSGSAGPLPGISPLEDDGDDESQKSTSEKPAEKSSDDDTQPEKSTCRWPSAVVLNSRVWRIKYVPKEHPEMEYDEDEHNWNLGTCNIPQRTIYVEDSQDDASKFDTLVHEMMHATFCTSAAPNPMKDDDRLEEECVLWATEAFFEIILNATSIVEDMMEHFHAARFLGPPSPR